MKTRYLVLTIICTIFACTFYGLKIQLDNGNTERTLKIGYIFVGDASTPYTYNFIKAEHAVAEKYGTKVTNIAKYNIPEGTEDKALQELVDEKCDIIITGSYGYATKVKEYAEKYPEIEFIAATGDNSNTEPKLSNYHTFMGKICEGRYISGVVAGMKLKEMIDTGVISEDEALLGYVGAFPYAEVISGYTSFFLGVRSQVPNAKMNVKYANTWSNYNLEKHLAEELIDEGCVIISQHSDTNGPAVACENVSDIKKVYHVGYNQSMTDIASSTSLISSRINWAPYMFAVVDAILSNKSIESSIDAYTYGTDSWAGIDKGWVEMLDLNHIIAAPGTEKAIENCIKDFEEGKINIFTGDYTGTNPFDPNDKIDLRNGFIENDKSSAPTFNYVLDDVIFITE